MSTFYYSRQHISSPEDSHYKITDDSPRMLITGHLTRAPNSLVWEIPVNGLAIVIFGQRTAILAPLHPPQSIPNDDDVFHNFRRRLEAMMKTILGPMRRSFPAHEPLEIFVVSRWHAHFMRDYIAEARRSIQACVAWRFIQWIEIPIWIPGSAGTASVIVGQDNGMPTLRLADDTWPIRRYHGYQYPIEVNHPDLFSGPVVRFRLADMGVVGTQNSQHMQHSGQGNMNLVVANIANQVSATTTYAGQAIPPYDYQFEAIGAVQGIEFPAGPSNSQSQPGHAW